MPPTNPLMSGTPAYCIQAHRFATRSGTVRKQLSDGACINRELLGLLTTPKGGTPCTCSKLSVRKSQKLHLLDGYAQKDSKKRLPYTSQGDNAPVNTDSTDATHPTVVGSYTSNYTSIDSAISANNASAFASASLLSNSTPLCFTL